MRVMRLLLWAAVLAALLIASFPAAAESGDCPPTDPACLPAPPGSIQVNPHPATADGDLADVAAPGELIPLEAVLPLPAPRVEVIPLGDGSAPSFSNLSVPVRYQDPSDVSCGIQALGMALDGLPGAPPTSSALLGFLQGNGMMYDFGTGVEELAYAAQSFGYKGSYAFHGASLEDLEAQLAAGSPVVVSLGANGPDSPGHFVTVTGTSPDGRWISYNDPTLGRLVVSAEEFLRLWGLQGNSGVVVATEPPASAPDLMPWVALAAGVMALVSTTPLGLRRMGVGGALVSGASGGSSGPGSPPYTAPAGYRWVSSQVPVYATREVQMGYETITRTVPRTERQRVQVGWDTVTERIPRYRSETYQDGWNITYDRVPRYRTERYISGYRTWTERRPEYMTIRGRRRLVGYEYVRRREPVYSTRSVFAGWDYRQQRTPIYRTRTVLDGYDIRTDRVPKYEWQDVVVGTQTITERVPRMVMQRVQTGTRTEWELERIPPPAPRFDGEEPPPTPTATSQQPTPTSWMVTPTHDRGSPSLTSTGMPSATPSATHLPSATPTPSTTPTPYWNAWVTPWTPAPTTTPVPGAGATQIAAAATEVAEFATVSRTGRSVGTLLTEANPRNFQSAGILSGILRGVGLMSAAEGEDARPFVAAANVADWFGADLLALHATREVQLARQATQAVTSGFAVRTTVGARLAEQLAAMSPHVVSAQPLLRGLQAVGSFGGVIAGPFQIAGGVAMTHNDDRYDDLLGYAQAIGGIATFAGSAITLAAVAIPSLVAAGGAMAVAVGAAPVLLGVGAIAAAGAIAYDYLKDKPLTVQANQRLEAAANRPGGFSDTATSTIQQSETAAAALTSMLDAGVPAPIAVLGSIAIGRVDQVFQSAGDAVSSLFGGIFGHDSGDA